MVKVLELLSYSLGNFTSEQTDYVESSLLFLL